jgi:hypothetical protein
VEPIIEDWLGQAAVGPASEDFKGARERFATLLPDLLSAFAKPTFVLPEARLDFLTLLPNQTRISRLGKGAIFYGETLVHEGKAEEGLSVFESVLILARNLQDSGGLAQFAVASMLRREAAWGMARAFPPEKQQSAAVLERAASMLRPDTRGDSALVGALEIELMAVVHTFDDIISGRIPRQAMITGGILYRVPGMLERERRIILNALSADLKQARSMGKPVARSSGATTLAQFLSGSRGGLSDLISWDLAQLAELHAFERVLAHGIVSCFELRAQKALDGESTGIAASSEGISWDPNQAKVTATATITSGHLLKGCPDWIRVEPPGLAFYPFPKTSR